MINYNQYKNNQNYNNFKISMNLKVNSKTNYIRKRKSN